MRRFALALLFLTVTIPPAAGRAGRPGYVAAVVTDGMVFPVARSSWYSVINFTNDWHAPRMRLIDGHWELVGVHEGNDIIAEPGTPVRAMLGGRVEQVGWTFYSGWRVGVRGVDGRYWFYGHLSSYEPGVVVGATVAAGDTLGGVGNTGYGLEPGHRDEFTYHLHFGIQEADGRWVNPYPLLKRVYRAATAAA